MDSGIEQFLSYIELELGLSANTAVAYRGDMSDFDAFCETLNLSLA